MARQWAGWMRMLVTVASMALAAATRSEARPGDLDPAFGGDGTVATMLTEYPRFLLTALMPDDQGRIVAGGVGSAAFLARYLTDGALDTTFGDGGKAIERRMSWAYRPPAFARTTDGRFYFAGVTFDGYDSPLLFRYDAEGRPDPSFGTDGMLPVDFDSFDMTALPGGALAIAGACRYAWWRSPSLQRLLPDGMPDPSFATPCWWQTEGAFLAMLAPTPATIVAAGLVAPPRGEYWERVAIGHFLADGSLDPAYGAHALVVAAALPFRPILVRVQPDGRVLAVDEGEAGDIHVARFEGDGSLDQSFGTGGIAHLPRPWQWNSWVQALTVQRDGRILIGGDAAPLDTDDGWDLMLARLLPNGTPDPGFGDAGFVLTDVVPYPEGYQEVAYAVVETSDGKIVAGGTAWDSADNGPVVLARHLGGTCGDGTVDAGETCDAGAANGTPASCCATDCTMRADGSACGSGNACVEHEACRAGTCVGGTDVVCPACTTCSPASGCVFVPRDDCPVVTAPARATFDLRRGVEARRHRVELRWQNGAPLPASELGDPTSGAGYALCLYRDEGAARSLLFGATTRATCGDRPCWRRTADRLVYVDPTGAPDGLTKVRADARKGTVKFLGAGALLRLPELPLETPAAVELRVDGGGCWRMPVDVATLRRHDAARVHAVAR